MTPQLTAPPPLDEIQSVVRAACEGGSVARVDLFGSVALGEASPRVAEAFVITVEFAIAALVADPGR